MFIGFQKDKNGNEFIAYVSNNKNDIENNPLIKFDSYAETDAPVELIDGRYVVGSAEIAKAKEAQSLAEAKAERAQAVEKIVVTVDGMKFDGDETAQGRMGRTIAAAIALGVDIETYTQTWVLADNTVAQVTIKQLAQALKLAGEAQTALWTIPYEATE